MTRKVTIKVEMEWGPEEEKQSWEFGVDKISCPSLLDVFFLFRRFGDQVLIALKQFLQQGGVKGRDYSRDEAIVFHQKVIPEEGKNPPPLAPKGPPPPPQPRQ